VRFSGTQREEDRKAFLSRKEKARAFTRIKATLNGMDAAAARYGVRIEKRDGKGEIQGAVVFFKDIDGSLAYNYTEERGKWKSPDLSITIGQFPLDGKSHTFAVGLADYKTGEVELLFDGKKVALVTCPPLARTSELVVGVYGEAEAGVQWSLILRNVCIFRKNK